MNERELLEMMRAAVLNLTKGDTIHGRQDGG